MRVKITMNSGEVFYKEGHALHVKQSFEKQGEPKNEFVEISPNVFINPSNISSLEQYIEKESRSYFTT